MKTQSAAYLDESYGKASAGSRIPNGGNKGSALALSQRTMTPASQ